VGNRGHGLNSTVYLNTLPTSALALGSLLTKNILDPAVVAAGYRQRVPVSDFSSFDFAVPRQGRLVFNRLIPNIHLWRITAAQPGGPWSASERFLTSTQEEMEPHYSPDGDRIAFQSRRSGEDQIWVSDRNATNPMQLTFLEGFVAGRPRWSPDGRWIAFKGTVAGNQDVYVVGSQAPDRSPGRGHESGMVLRGKYTEFQSNRDPAARRWRVPAAGGEAEKRKSENTQLDCGLSRLPGGLLSWPFRPADAVAQTGRGRDDVVIAEPLHPTARWQIFSDGIYYVSQPVDGGPSPILGHGGFEAPQPVCFGLPRLANLRSGPA
jgi:WD40-like Beta Propeller Repeat